MAWTSSTDPNRLVALAVALFACAARAEGPPRSLLDLPESLRAAAAGGRRMQLEAVLGSYRLRAGTPTLVAVAAGGEVAATTEGDGWVRFWDLLAGAERRILRTHHRQVTALVFDPKGLGLATGGRDGPVAVWDARTGKRLALLAGHRGEVSALAFSADGRRLASAGEDRVVRLWDLRARRQLRALVGHSDWVRAVAFSPGGAELLSAGDDGTVRVQGLGKSGRTTVLGKAGDGPIRSLAPSADGLAVLAVGETSASLFFTGDGRRLALFEGARTVLAAGFSGNGRRAAVWVRAREGEGRQGIAARQFEVATGAEGEAVHLDTGPAWRVGLSEGGAVAMVGGDEGTAVWVGDERRAASEGHRGAVAAVAAHPLEGRLLTAARDGTARLWNARAGDSSALAGFGQEVKAAAFSPDGTLGGVADVAGELRLFSVVDGAPRGGLGRHRGVQAFGFAVDGQRAVSLSFERFAVWNLESGAEVRSAFFGGLATRVAPDPAGRRALVGGPARAQLVDLATGKTLITLAGTGPAVQAMAFSPDGRRAALAVEGEGRRAAVGLWRLDTGARVGQVALLPKGALALAWSPDGRLLACAGEDGAIGLYDARRRRLVERFDLSGHGERPTSMAFLSGGQGLAVGTSLGAVLLFSIAPP